MKTFKYYISEWKLNDDDKTVKVQKYNYHPKTKEDLERIVRLRLKENPRKPHLLDIDTSEIKSFSYLFCVHPQSHLAGSGIDTDELEILNLSTWMTHNVESMEQMFMGCEKLRFINMKSFNTSKLKFASNMFYECKNLTKLDLSMFSTKNLTQASGMFYNCENLKEIKGLSSWDISNVNNAFYMFKNCKALEGESMATWDFKANSVHETFMGVKRSLVPILYR